MSLSKRPSHYYAFLLRMWEENGQLLDEQGVWRFSLEDSQTGQRKGFASLEKLVAFLLAQAGAAENARPKD